MKKLLLSHSLFLISYFAFAQNIGIGTTSPQSRLHIISSADEALRLDANQPFLSLHSNGVYKGYFWKSPNSIEIGSAAGSNLPVTIAPDGFQRMYIAADGNIGIGTITPSQKLEVNGTTYLNGLVGIQNNNPTAPLTFAAVYGKKITFYRAGTSDAGLALRENVLELYSNDPNADIAFGYEQNNNFIERMRVKGNGNVGIGTTGPTEKLEIAGSIKAGSYKYLYPKTYYYSIPATGFQGALGSDNFYKDGFDIHYSGLNPPVSIYIVAPVYLPHGATITEFHAYYNDVSSSTDISVRLSIRGHSQNVLGAASTITSSGTPGLSSGTNLITLPLVVNNQQNTYFIEASPSSGTWPTGNSLTLRSVLIVYTFSEVQ